LTKQSAVHLLPPAQPLAHVATLGSICALPIAQSVVFTQAPAWIPHITLAASVSPPPLPVDPDVPPAPDVPVELELVVDPDVALDVVLDPEAPIELEAPPEPEL